MVPIKITTPEHVVGGKREHFTWIGFQVEVECVNRTVVVTVIIDRAGPESTIDTES